MLFGVACERSVLTLFICTSSLYILNTKLLVVYLFIYNSNKKISFSMVDTRYIIFRSFYLFHMLPTLSPRPLLVLQLRL